MSIPVDIAYTSRARSNDRRLDVRGMAVFQAIAPGTILASMRALALVLLTTLLVAASAAADPPESRTWIEISVFCQCCEAPWGKSESAIRPFFHRNRIPVYGYRKEARTVCAACTCPSPLKQMIRIRADDVPRVRTLLERSPNERRLPSVRP